MSYQASNAKGQTTTQILAPANAANTAAATSAGVDVSEYEGALTFTQNVGVVTGGSITGKLVTSDASDLSGAVDVTGGGFTAVSTSNDPAIESVHIQCSALKKYVGYIGTIATGPAQVGVSMIGSKATV